MTSIHNVKPKSYLVCDTETTGLNPKKDRLLEVGLLEVKDGVSSEPTSMLVSIPFDVPSKITQLTGISNEEVKSNSFSIECVLDSLYRALESHQYIIGHNFFLFDHHFLHNEAQRIDHPLKDFLTLDRIIDTAVLFKGWGLDIKRREEESHLEYAYWVLQQRVSFKFNLQHACGELNIDISNIEKHRAAGDVTMTSKLYSTLQHMDI